jgi:hypothetical protein
MAETAGGGPFPELLDGTSFRPLVLSISPWLGLTLFLDLTVDIVVNCIYLTEPIPHFLTADFIAKAGKDRKLGCLVDVSCESVPIHLCPGLCVLLC